MSATSDANNVIQPGALPEHFGKPLVEMRDAIVAMLASCDAELKDESDRSPISLALVPLRYALEALREMVVQHHGRLNAEWCARMQAAIRQVYDQELEKIRERQRALGGQGDGAGSDELPLKLLH